MTEIDSLFALLIDLDIFSLFRFLRPVSMTNVYLQPGMLNILAYIHLSTGPVFDKCVSGIPKKPITIIGAYVELMHI